MRGKRGKRKGTKSLYHDQLSLRREAHPDSVLILIDQRRTTDYGPSDHPDQHYEPPNPCKPTDAVPGTREKVQILADRVMNGQQLFHEDDRGGVLPWWKIAEFAHE